MALTQRHLSEENLVEPFIILLIDYNKAKVNLMKRYIRSNWEYTALISEELPIEVVEFLQKDIDELDYRSVKDAVDSFFEELKRIPSGKEELNIIYDRDKGRIYKKYRPFVDKCKQLQKRLHPTGYGKNDYVDIKKLELCKSVDYNFPYGWKYMI